MLFAEEMTEAVKTVVTADPNTQWTVQVTAVIVALGFISQLVLYILTRIDKAKEDKKRADDVEVARLDAAIISKAVEDAKIVAIVKADEVKHELKVEAERVAAAAVDRAMKAQQTMLATVIEIKKVGAKTEEVKTMVTEGSHIAAEKLDNLSAAAEKNQSTTDEIHKRVNGDNSVD